MASESIAHSLLTWAIDSEPTRARGIIVKYRGWLGVGVQTKDSPYTWEHFLQHCRFKKITTAVVHVSWLTKFSPLTTSLCLRLVSPSRLAVSMWHIELASLEFNNSKSAGMISSLCSLMKSPTTTFFHAVFWYSCVSLEVTKHDDIITWLVSDWKRKKANLKLQCKL